MSELRNCLCGGPALGSETPAQSSRGEHYQEYYVECILCLRSMSGCSRDISEVEVGVSRSLVIEAWNSFQEKISE